MLSSLQATHEVLQTLLNIFFYIRIAKVENKNKMLKKRVLTYNKKVRMYLTKG